VPRATALFFTAPEKLAETFSFAYAWMFADGRVDVSHALPQLVLLPPAAAVGLTALTRH
jgi:hypothetical protein